MFAPGLAPLSAVEPIIFHNLTASNLKHHVPDLESSNLNVRKRFVFRNDDLMGQGEEYRRERDKRNERNLVLGFFLEKNRRIGG